MPPHPKPKTFSKSFAGVVSSSTSGFERHGYFSRAELDWWPSILKPTGLPQAVTWRLKIFAFYLPFQTTIVNLRPIFRLTFTWKNTINKLTHAIAVADHRSAECTGNVFCFVRVQDRGNWNHIQQIPAYVLCTKEKALWSFGPQETRLWSRFLWIQEADQWYRGL